MLGDIRYWSAPCSVAAICRCKLVLQCQRTRSSPDFPHPLIAQSARTGASLAASSTLPQFVDAFYRVLLSMLSLDGRSGTGWVSSASRVSVWLANCTEIGASSPVVGVSGVERALVAALTRRPQAVGRGWPACAAYPMRSFLYSRPDASGTCRRTGFRQCGTVFTIGEVKVRSAK